MSIRLRLTLWYSGLLALAIGFFGTSLFFFMDYSLHRDLDDALASRAGEVLVGYGAGGPGTLDLFATPDIFVQIVTVTANGIPLLQARSTNLAATGVELPVPQHIPANGTYDTETVQGEQLRIYTLPITRGSALIALIQVGRRLAPVQDTLAHLRLQLILSGGGVLLLAALLGWWLQGRALAPIARITEAAQEIGSSGDLSQRVPYEGPEDELGKLATTFNAMLKGLEASRRAQQDALTAQRRFVADASHELRTPLTIIRGNLSVLERSFGAASPDVREALQDMGSEAQHMSNLVADLLTLARADAGVHLSLTPTTLDGVVAEAARGARRLAESKGIQFSVDTDAVADVVVLASAEHLSSLLLSLLDNAVKYTPAGGHVRLAGQREGDGVRLSVTDTGPGIASEHLPHLFERFYRASKPKEEGSGLGLSIAKWIADEHGGRLSVVSQPGQGSSFSLWLPFAPESKIGGND